jgi:hypothetical protein
VLVEAVHIASAREDSPDLDELRARFVDRLLRLKVVEHVMSRASVRWVREEG